MKSKSAGAWRWVRRRRSDAGQALVEFALVLPIFLVLTFGLVDFGRGFYTWLLLTNAAREGARAGAVQSTSTEISNKVYLSYCSSLPATPGNCSLNPSKMSAPGITNAQGPRGEQVTVSLTFDFDFVTPISGMLQLIGGSALAEPTITASSSMRLE